MSDFRICIVGGIFDKPDDYRIRHCFTPETVLSDGLRSLGFDIKTYGHRNFVPSEDYDLVHVHHLGKAALRMATAKTSAFFVYTSHDPKLVSQYKLPLKRMMATRFVVSRADAMVVLSNVEMNYMEKLFGKYHTKFVVIQNGFPSKVFFCKDSNIPSKAPCRMLFVGQLIPQKGFDVLLKAFKNVSMSKEIELQVVYQTSELETYYKNMTTQLGIEKKVHFLGFKSAYELAEIYRNADLFILPTYAEALPSVITEAMMCGTPIIATDVAGIPEQVGKFGILVKPGDTESLTFAIFQALEHMADLKAQAIEGSNYAKAKFSIEMMLQKHIRLYQELLFSGRFPKRQYWPRRLLNVVTRLLTSAILH